YISDNKKVSWVGGGKGVGHDSAVGAGHKQGIRSLNGKKPELLAIIRLSLSAKLQNSFNKFLHAGTFRPCRHTVNAKVRRYFLRPSAQFRRVQSQKGTAYLYTFRGLDFGR